MKTKLNLLFFGVCFCICLLFFINSTGALGANANNGCPNEDDIRVTTPSGDVCCPSEYDYLSDGECCSDEADCVPATPAKAINNGAAPAQNGAANNNVAPANNVPANDANNNDQNGNGNENVQNGNQAQNGNQTQSQSGNQQSANQSSNKTQNSNQKTSSPTNSTDSNSVPSIKLVADKKRVNPSGVYCLDDVSPISNTGSINESTQQTTSSTTPTATTSTTDSTQTTSSTPTTTPSTTITIGYDKEGLDFCNVFLPDELDSLVSGNPDVVFYNTEIGDKEGYENTSIKVPSGDKLVAFLPGHCSEIMDYLNKNMPAGTEAAFVSANIDPDGYVYAQSITGKEIRILGATVNLYWLNPDTNKYELWPAEKYQQKNPQITKSAGDFSFLVPAGFYYLQAIGPFGYSNYKSTPFEVSKGHPVFLKLKVNPYWWQVILSNWIVILVISCLLVALILLFYYFNKKRKNRIEVAGQM